MHKIYNPVYAYMARQDIEMDVKYTPEKFLMQNIIGIDGSYGEKCEF